MPTAATASGAGSRPAGSGANNVHADPAHAAFDGDRQSGIGRENHKTMLDHDRQTKTILMRDNPNKLGFF